jgi:hypothetical protein
MVDALTFESWTFTTFHFSCDILISLSAVIPNTIDLVFETECTPVHILNVKLAQG